MWLLFLPPFLAAADAVPPLLPLLLLLGVLFSSYSVAKYLYERKRSWYLVPVRTQRYVAVCCYCSLLFVVVVVVVVFVVVFVVLLLLSTSARVVVRVTLDHLKRHGALSRVRDAAHRRQHCCY